MGNNTQPGILPRLSEDLFEMAGQSHVHIQVKLIMLELYQDSLIDLLLVEPSAGMVHKAKPAALEIKLDAKGNVSIPEATAEPANDMAQLNSLIAAAMKRRSTAATLMNFESSRSHLFVIMLLHVSNPTTGTSSTSKLTLVDLAGSERVTKSGSLKDRERLAEATSINKSLSALGDVVSALTTQNSGHVPYRNSKLTMLLADSLGGNAKTLLLVTLNPLSGNFAETKNSLEYAQRTKQVVNTASKSVETREIARLKAIIDKQSAELAGKKDKPKPTSLDPEIKSPGRRDRPLSATPVKRQNSLRS